MMAFVRQGQSKLRRLATEPAVHTALEGVFYFGSAFLLSAASLGNHFMPIGAGFVCACAGGGGIFATLGAVSGYLLFWSAPQGVAWCAVALLLSALLSGRRVCKEVPLLLPMAAAVNIALWGVIFQRLGRDDAPIIVFVLRVILAGATAGLFVRLLRERNPLMNWLACGVATLALAQCVVPPYLGLGYAMAGVLIVRGSFPAAALSGLALDLAGITNLPMTAIVCLTYLIRFLPRCPKWLGAFSVVSVSSAVMYISGIWDMLPLPGLFLGALLGGFLPLQAPATHRRGETGLAQVRLELAAGVMAQAEQLLLECPNLPVDEDALVARAAETACGGCPCRKGCRDVRRIAALPGLLLHKPLVSVQELPIICKKSGRFLAELHRSQAQLRSILADRERQWEYRTAILQQYRFLSGYLQELSDTLTHRPDSVVDRYKAEVEVFGNRPESGSGDRCIRFMGPGGRYYVILCDGMGTGPEAAIEARTGGDLLRRLLCAGFPAEHALSSLNSICALRERAGVLTVDMAEICTDSGTTTLYKWGAAPSYVLYDGRTEKLGVPTPPPGLSVEEKEQMPKKLSLRRGQRLVMVSDGVGEDGALRICRENVDVRDAILAQKLLEHARLQGEDDATVVCIRLKDLEKNA